MEEISEDHPAFLKKTAEMLIKYVFEKQPDERHIMGFCGALIKGVLDAKNTNALKRKIYAKAYDQLINKEFSNI